MHSVGEVHTSIKINRSTHSRVQQVDLANVPFSSVFSDHMFAAEFHDSQWTQGEIQPYGPISISPSISALHYGIAVFEGMKAHKSSDGHPLLFRARENARRLQRSAARLALPGCAGIPVLGRPPRSCSARIKLAILMPSRALCTFGPILFSVDPSIRVKPARAADFSSHVSVRNILFRAGRRSGERTVRARISGRNRGH